VFVVNRNVLKETWDGNGFSSPIYNKDVYFQLSI
jgi:hypothetical protein